MLYLFPRRWYSWDFKVFEDDRPIAVIDRSWFREEGALVLEEAAYRVYRLGMASGAFILEKDGFMVAEANKPHIYRNLFEIEYEGRTFTLRPRWLRRRFDLYEGEARVGSIAPLNPFTRKATADLPGDLPLAVRVFILWLVLLLWKRAADAAA